MESYSPVFSFPHMHNQVAFGTQYLEGKKGIALCDLAWSSGYRIFDTAISYSNHSLISEALKKRPRESYRIVSKIALPNMLTQSVTDCVIKALYELETDYIDAMLIHAPKGVDHIHTLTQLIELKEKKIIRAVGVSNYTLRHLSGLANSGIVPDILQVEIHPFLQEEELIWFCRENDITVMAHSAFAHGLIFNDTEFDNLATEIQHDAGQIAVHWALVRGTIPIISSSNKRHIVNNIRPLPIDVTNTLISKLSHMNRHLRICNNTEWSEFESLE